MTELPKDWREVNLSEVCDYVRGVTYGKSDARNEPTEGCLPLLRATNIDERRIVLSDFVFVPESKVKPLQLLRKGDLVFAASSGSIQLVGKSAPVPEGFFGTFGAFCAVLRPVDGSIHKYLDYFVSSPLVREVWSAAARGTNINNLKREIVLGTLMPLPPVAEQERIVEILEEQFTRLDIALARIRAVREKSKAFRKSMLAAAFRGAFSGGDEMVIPTDWSLLPLDQVSEVRLGRQRSPRDHLGPKMRPYLRAANVTWKGIDLTDVKEMNFNDDEFAVFRLEPGDILVSEASGSPNEVGKAAVFQGEIDDCCFQNTLLRVRSNSVDKRYLHYFLMGVALSGAYATESRGVGINHLGRARLASWLVPLAPPDEQRDIADLLDEQFSRLDAAVKVAEQLEIRLELQRRSLLHVAFSGTLTAQWRETYV